MATLTGLDILAREGCRRLQGLRVGLVTNPTAITRDRRHIISVLVDNGIRVTVLFGPEHGISGDHDETLRVADGVDPTTGLPVYSLFSDIERPTHEQLRDVDLLVFDIADVGMRYYTYTTTMVYCMQQAAGLNIRFMVLDRPNPITGAVVEGPVLDPAFRCLPAYFKTPTRHGMTPGELALLANAEYGIECDLQVVACEGWPRNLWFDETGLPWVNPSPNLRNLNQVTLYAVTAGLEFSQLSVGRGTESPFEVFGAPYIDGVALAQRLNGLPDLHLRFVPIEFTPSAHCFEAERCRGCFIFTNDRAKLRPVEANVRLACELVRMYPGKLDAMQSELLLGGPAIARAIQSGTEAQQIIDAWRPQLRDFTARREQYLLYAPATGRQPTHPDRGILE